MKISSKIYFYLFKQKLQKLLEYVKKFLETIIIKYFTFFNKIKYDIVRCAFKE